MTNTILTVGQLFESINNGSTCKADFITRTLFLDNRQITLDPSSLQQEKNSLTNTLDCIEALYARYKHSIPSQRESNRQRNYFNALKEEQLDEEDMLYGEKRGTARAKLEAFFVISLLNGSLHWDEQIMGTGWFWQSKKDKDLVILKQWIQK